MKTITRTIYVADDGAEFLDQQKCRKYEDDGCVDMKPIPEYCDKYPLTEQNVRMLCGGDGSCYYATNTQMSRITPRSTQHPKWATQLVYFGK